MIRFPYFFVTLVSAWAISRWNNVAVALHNPNGILFHWNNPSSHAKPVSLGSQLKEWYQDATSTPYGHLLIGLKRKKVDSLRYCTNSGSVLSKFSGNEHTIRLYTPNFSKIFPKLQKQFIVHCQLSKNLIQFLSAYLVNLLRGELNDLQIVEVVKYRREISELTRGRIPLHERRTNLS